MISQALKEVRYHPGRVVATIVAIAISIGFLSTISIFLRTQGTAEGKRQAIYSTRADSVVTVTKAIEKPDKVTKAIEGTDGVKDVEPLYSSSGMASHNGSDVMGTSYSTPSEGFRWSKLTEGKWPEKPNQVVASKDGAKKLDLKVGDTFKFNDQDATLVGIADEPKALLNETFYVDGSGESDDGDDSTWLVHVKPGSDATAVNKAIVKNVAGVQKFDTNDPVTAQTAKQFQDASIKDLIGSFDVTKYGLMIFGAIALLVGVIIISTTFGILLAQRRRQIGLMRAVGASGGYVRRMVLGEAIVLGVLGSLFGIVLGIVLSLIGAARTGALWFGLSWPVGELVGEFLIGVLITVLAAFLPAIRATRVAPLEALRPVPTVEERRKASIARIIVCSLLFLIGVGLSVLTFRVDNLASIPVAIGSAILLSIAVLAAAPLYVPSLIKLFGLVIRPFGPTARLSTSNAVRNPSRTSLTAVALMLAVGLSMTLQIGTATMRSTGDRMIEEHFPVDMQISTLPPLDEEPAPDGEQSPANAQSGSSKAPDATAGASNGRSGEAPVLPKTALRTIDDLPNVASQLQLESTLADLGDKDKASYESSTVVYGAEKDKMSQISDVVSEKLNDDTILVNENSQFRTGEKIKVAGSKGTIELSVVKISGVLDFSEALTTTSTLDRLSDNRQVSAVWMKMQDRTNMTSVMQRLTPLMSTSGVSVNGGFPAAGMLDKILDVILMIITALLGVAVLIALVGVANTLGLSVLERRRESALLRAMGMQKRSLRLMLLHEALQTSFVGVFVGVVAGGYFAWLGISSIFRAAGTNVQIHFGVDWPWTIGLILICMAAAALASILPGSHAARTAPTEALAEE
ncbi:MAG: FtsX-like permease family protein [Cutibacterium granulosum]|uniref:ABC transporter permease n=1 Tax=Cutibacterium granulosum TaxID=33011 RepID=UPI002B235A7D|nr:FtsX-like permease family protein [Cutibacterium granulosum]MEA5648817.1 FtsX-like permease family protein [Cutibacterium granulosum]MEA5653718.1 FtsX-like permease family protein [Cutibacterium granulosum]MEA5663427.1 FtsX-like permease family protein [Cutibacterium granulosum]MEA5664100.1 FtsX-like permease family protein [Cutibacterium granulosum]